MACVIWTPRHPALRELIAALLRETSPIYLVGGAVRDIFMRRALEPHDADIVLEPPAAPSARRVADRLGWAYYVMDEGRDVSRLIFNANAGEHLVVDISAMQGSFIENDLRQRDFTVNAMAVALHKDGRSEAIDILDGQRDLERGVLRVVSPLSLVDDPVRTLRAVRLLVQLEFRLETSTRDQVARLAPSIRFASPERVRDELWKMFATRNAAQALRELLALGLLMQVLPELDTTGRLSQTPVATDTFARILSAVEFAVALRDWLLARPPSPQNPLNPDVLSMLQPYCYRFRRLYQEPVAANRLRAEWLVWSALFLAVSMENSLKRESPSAQVTPESSAAQHAASRLSYLRFSRAEIMLVEKTLTEHRRPIELHRAHEQAAISRRECYRYFRHTDGKPFSYRAGIDALFLSLIDYSSSYAGSPPDLPIYLAHMDQLLAFAFEPKSSGSPAPLVDGHLLIKRLRIAPGKQLGDLLDHLMEAQAVGDIATQEDAIDLASSWLRERD